MIFFVELTVCFLIVLISITNGDPYLDSVASNNISAEGYFTLPQPALKCPDYVRHARGDQAKALHIVQKEVLSGGFKPAHVPTLQYVNVSSPGQEFVICAMPENVVTNPTGFPLENMIGGERMQLLNNSDVMRIKLVQNPYIRAISLYQDNVAKMTPNKDEYHMNFSQIPSYDEWVAQLFHDYLHAQIDPLFISQYDSCWENIGLNFDYILKTEKFSFWNQCFEEDFSLQLRALSDEINIEDRSLGSHDMNESMDGHEQFLKLREFYKNETTAIKIAKIYFDDIVQYGYPFWTDYMNGFY